MEIDVCLSVYVPNLSNDNTVYLVSADMWKTICFYLKLLFLHLFFNSFFKWNCTVTERNMDNFDNTRIDVYPVISSM